MATTSRQFAQRVLEALVASGADFALVRDLNDSPAGPFSDVDLVVSSPPRAVVAGAMPLLLSCDLRPIMFWPYDASGSAALFVVSPDASEGAQIDMLYDPTGRDGYRVRTGALLDGARKDGALRVLGHVDRLVYLWQKRRAKRQMASVAAVVEEATLVPEQELRAIEHRITGATSLADSAFRSAPVPGFRTRRRLADVRRLLSRLRHPVGLWVHAGRAELAAELAERLAQVLVSVRVEEFPSRGSARVAWRLRRVWPEMLRPHAVVSWGDVPAGGRAPDAVVSGSTAEAARAMTGLLSDRVERCVS